MTFLACSAALSFLILCSSAKSAAVSSSSLSESDSSSSSGSSASKLAAGTWSSFCLFALDAAESLEGSMARRLDPLSFSARSLSSNSFLKSRFRNSSMVPWPCSLQSIYQNDKKHVILICVCVCVCMYTGCLILTHTPKYLKNDVLSRKMFQIKVVWRSLSDKLLIFWHGIFFGPNMIQVDFFDVGNTYFFYYRLEF